MYPRSFLCEEAKIRQRTPLKKEFCKIGEEAIWESRFTSFLIIICAKFNIATQFILKCWSQDLIRVVTGLPKRFCSGIRKRKYCDEYTGYSDYDISVSTSILGIGYLFIYGTIILFNNLLISFRHYYCAQ